MISVYFDYIHLQKEVPILSLFAYNYFFFISTCQLDIPVKLQTFLLSLCKGFKDQKESHLVKDLSRILIMICFWETDVFFSFCGSEDMHYQMQKLA